MTCVGCGAHSPITPRKWREENTSQLRARGWFVWDRHAPVAYHGVVVCPSCREADPLLERRPAALAMEVRAP